MDDSAAWRLGRRPALDGLRGVGILIVLGCHVFALGSKGPDRLHPLSAVGVTLFFVLSGFLITALVAEEYERTGTVALGQFYVRRARRLLPALALVLITVGPLALAQGRMAWRDVLSIALYYANFFHPALFGQAWSLSIEEQFYLVWPVVLILTLWRPRLALIVASIGCAASMMWTLLLPTLTGADPYERTDVHAAALLAGCALALAARRGLPLIRTGWMTYASLTGLCAFWLVGGWSARDDALVLVSSTLVAGVALWSACGAPAALLTAPPLRFLGARSYGLYLWHYPVMVFVFGASVDVPLVERLLALALSFAAAEVSWRLVEGRFTRRSSRSRDPGYAAQELVGVDVLGSVAPRG